MIRRFRLKERSFRWVSLDSNGRLLVMMMMVMRMIMIMTMMIMMMTIMMIMTIMMMMIKTVHRDNVNYAH